MVSSDLSRHDLPLIQGKKPRSKEEYFISVALSELGWEYIYQYPVMGGMTMMGGAVLDWLVLTQPIFTPLEYYGGYWHRGQMSSKDKMRQLMIERTLGFKAGQMVIIWQKDGVVDVPSAKRVVADKIGIGK